MHDEKKYIHNNNKVTSKDDATFQEYHPFQVGLLSLICIEFST